MTLYQKNKPFLLTQEMFKLKWAMNVSDTYKYIDSNEQYKRDILSNILSVMNLSLVGTNNVSMEIPNYIYDIEWFSSTNSICQGMFILKNKNSQQVLDILAKNNPFPYLSFDYIGYKGGSEPGVLTLNFLFRKHNVYNCLSFAISNSQKDINKYSSIDIISKTVRLFSNNPLNFTGEARYNYLNMFILLVFAFLLLF